jgi:hypothetical protein
MLLHHPGNTFVVDNISLHRYSLVQSEGLTPEVGQISLQINNLRSRAPAKRPAANKSVLPQWGFCEVPYNSFLTLSK